MALTRLVIGFAILLTALLLPAGTTGYWEAWVYLGVLFTPVCFAFGVLLAKDPALLERRMRMKEKERSQSLLLKLGSVAYLLVFLIPGFDRRFGWSEVPASLVVLADVLVLAGYGLFLLVLRENSYASRIVEVEEGQRVISTGPYSVVRHPMYLAILVMFLSTPVALGSWWALIPAAAVVGILVARIRGEERLLRAELEGYREYAERTRYRLIPGLW